mgnify:FL=1
MESLFFATFGYLSGSILFGYWIPKVLKKVDICAVSKDGNPGTANAFLYAGAGCGILVLLCDLAKGFLPVFFAVHFFDPHSPLFSVILAAPVLGHAWPIFHRGKRGGKGIAVSFGALLGLFPDVSFAFFLAFWYILFSIVWIIQPHCLRTAVTYIAWTINIGVSEKSRYMLPGILLIALIVIQKHMDSLRELEKGEGQIRFLFRRS